MATIFTALGRALTFRRAGYHWELLFAVLGAVLGDVLPDPHLAALTTTGNPCDIASSTTIAKVSSSVGCTSTVAARLAGGDAREDGEEGLVEGQVHNHITVPEDQKRDAKLALDRMLQV